MATSLRHLGAGIALAGSTLLARGAAFAEAPGPPPATVTRRLADVRIHAIHTGWVRVKEAHRTLRGPNATRLLAILLSRAWTEWMPVIVYAIEHPEGTFLVDAGLSQSTLLPDHFACDAGTRWFYANQLRFAREPEDGIDRRLAALGIDATRVGGVVLTHQHADHSDGLELLPGMQAFFGAEDAEGHLGSLPCRRPPSVVHTPVSTAASPFGAFTHSRPLTRDGRVRIVPLPGHSPGHLGVLLRTEAGAALFAGDAAFDAAQVEHRTLAGIVASPDAARETLDAIARQLTLEPTFLLPAHDAAGVARFASGQVTVLPEPSPRSGQHGAPRAPPGSPRVAPGRGDSG